MSNLCECLPAELLQSLMQKAVSAVSSRGKSPVLIQAEASGLTDHA